MKTAAQLADDIARIYGCVPRPAYIAEVARAIEARDRETVEDVFAALSRCGGRSLIDDVRDDLAGPDQVPVKEVSRG